MGADYEVEIRFQVDADSPAQAVEFLFRDIEAAEPVPVFFRLSGSGDEFEMIREFPGPADGGKRTHSAVASYTFEASDPAGAAREFLGILAAHRSWYIEVLESSTGARFNVDAESGNVEELGPDSAPCR